jgi:hypothetical protein
VISTSCLPLFALQVAHLNVPGSELHRKLHQLKGPCVLTRCMLT